MGKLSNLEYLIVKKQDCCKVSKVTRLLQSRIEILCTISMYDLGNASLDKVF